MAKTKKKNKGQSKAQRTFADEVLSGNVRRFAIGKQDMEPTSAADWKKSQAPTDAVPLPLPSGNTALVQPLGMPELLKRGLIPNPLISSISSVLTKADARMTGGDPEKAEKKARKELAEQMDTWAQDPTKMAAVFEMADSITLACVLKPEVHPAPEPGEDGSVSRDPGLLYIDQVDVDDKFYVMSFGMSGVRDLDGFRAELAGSVGALGNGGEVDSSAE